MDLERTELLDRLATHSLTCVVAGAGFGKSHLAQQLVDRDVPMAVYDDAQRATDTELLTWLDEAEAESRSVVILGRILPSQVIERASLVLQSEDLEFTDRELKKLANHAGVEVAEPLTRLLGELSLRWPRAAVSVLLDIQREQERGSGGLSRVARRSSQRTSLIRPVVDALDDLLPLARTLASLAFFDDEIIRLLGFEPEAARTDMALAGLPAERSHGWYRFPQALKQLLQDEPLPLLEVKTDLLAAHYRSRHETIVGIDACLAFGDADAAAELVASFDFRDSIPEVGELNQRLALCRSALDRHPRAWLVQWWANLDNMDMQVGLAALQRAEQAVRNQAPVERRLWAEVFLELAYEAYMGGDQARAKVLLDESGAADPRFDQSAIRARMYEVSAGVASLEGDESSLERAQRELTAAISYWRQSGETVRAVAAMFRLALHVLEPLGRHGDALGVLDDIERHIGLSATDTARVVVLRSRFLARLGRVDSALAAADRASEAAAVLELPWMAGYAAWSRISCAPLVRTAENSVDVAAEFARATDGLGDLLGRDTGHMFYCEVAVAMARVGAGALARRCLASAAELTTETPNLMLATAWVEAELGDANWACDVATNLEATLEPGRRWEASMVLARAAERSNDPIAAGIRVEEARQAASATQLGEMVELHAARLEAQSADRSGTSLRLFDGFEVLINGAATRPLIGHASTVIKLIVVNRGRIKVDQAVDVLWPDADMTTGRRRLRNVLSRARVTLGRSIVVRRGDVLALEDDVSADFQHALDAADRALRLAPETADVAIEALRLMPAADRLLVEDRYADWATEIRSSYANLRSEVERHRDRLARSA